MAQISKMGPNISVGRESWAEVRRPNPKAKCRRKEWDDSWERDLVEKQRLGTSGGQARKRALSSTTCVVCLCYRHSVNIDS